MFDVVLMNGWYTLFVVDDVCMSGMDHQTGVAVLPTHTRPKVDKYLNRK